MLLTLLVYWPVLGLGFVWDDAPLYLNVPALRDATTLWGGTFESVVPGLHFFRPVALLTFKLQFLWFGDSAQAAHAIGLALHAVNTGLVAGLAVRLQAPAPGPGPAVRVALAGLLYGLHPALVEPVAWMSCRFDLLVAFWLLLALHADAGIPAPLPRAGAVATLYLLALCSKEMAAPFPAVLALFQLATRYRGVPWRELPRRAAGEAPGYALLVLAGLAYVAMRSAFIGGAVDTDPDVVEALGGFGGRAAFVAATVLLHLRTLAWPFGSLSPLHPVDLAELRFTTGDLPELAAVAALLVALGLGVWRKVPALMLAAAALLALFPVLNVMPLSIGRNLGHERYLTFPLALAALALAALPWPGPGSRRLTLARTLAGLLGVAWLGASVANIRVTIPLWQSDLSLWSWALARHPDSDYAHHSLVTSLLRAGRPDLAERHFTEAIPSTTYRAETQFRHARFLIEHGDRERGAAHMRRALQGFPPWHRQPPQQPAELRDLIIHSATIALGYTYLAELALDERRYAEALELAATADHYASERRLTAMTSALARYGLDQPEEAERLAQAALDLAGDAAERERLLRLRGNFLRHLCAAPAAERPRRTCRHQNRP